MAYGYPPQTSGSNTVLMAVMVCAVVYFVYTSTKSTAGTYTPPTPAEIQAYKDNINNANTGTSILNDLTSGTGSRLAKMIMYPEIELTGWDTLGKAVDVMNPIVYNSDTGKNETNFMYIEDYTFFTDVTTSDGTVVTDSNGSKMIPFAKVVGGSKKYYFKSLKVNPGTYMMITTLDGLGTPDATGFILWGRDCRDVTKLLSFYPELAQGNNGIHWDRAREGDEWRITVLDKTSFHREVLAKWNRCMGTASGISNESENRDMGLHYKDGSRILGSTYFYDTQGGAKDLAVGRWLYDHNCNPILDPKNNRQAYSTEYGSGWGMNCTDATRMCSLQGTLIGVPLDQKNTDLGINADGYPTFLIENVPGGTAVAESSLTDYQLGWVQGISDAPPAAADILSGDATPAPTSAFSAGPNSTVSTASRHTTGGKLSRFSDRSSNAATTSGPDGNSLETSHHRSGYSHTSADRTSLKYAASLS